MDLVFPGTAVHSPVGVRGVMEATSPAVTVEQLHSILPEQQQSNAVLGNYMQRIQSFQRHCLAKAVRLIPLSVVQLQAVAAAAMSSCMEAAAFELIRAVRTTDPVAVQQLLDKAAASPRYAIQML